MSLITNSDDYSPSINNEGNYIDHIPSFNNYPQGLRCPCTHHIFHSRSNFATHIKCANHKKWIESLNSNRANYFVELEKERQLVKEQKIIIAQKDFEITKLEREKHKMLEMIHFLSNVNRPREPPLSSQQDLLDFN